MKKPLNTTYKYDERAMELNPNSEEYKKILDHLASNGEFDVHTTKFKTNNAKKLMASMYTFQRMFYIKLHVQYAKQYYMCSDHSSMV